MAKISIIVPIYNTNFDYFNKCIESIINQTIKDIEILLIDDGSTNGISDVCDNYKEKDTRIRVIHKANQGVSSARNIGIKESKSNWIMFVDADDWLEINACEKLYSYINDDTDIIIGRTYLYMKNKQLPTFYNANKINKIVYKETKEELAKTILTDEHIKYSYLSVPWNKLYRKSSIVKNNIMFKEDLFYGEDNVFNFEMYLKSKQILIVDEIIYFYRINEESITHNFNNNICENMKKLFNYLDNLIGDNEILRNALYYYKLRCLDYILTSYYKTNRDIFFSKRIIKDTTYKEAVKRISVKDINKVKKILVFFFKINNYFGITILYRLKNKKDSIERK